MPANRYGIDVAEIYRNKADLERSRASTKGQKINNELGQIELDETKRAIAERPKIEAAKLERQNTLSGLRQDAAGGNTDAAHRLMALDPENGPKFIEQINSMDDRQREQMQSQVDEIGNLSAYVLQGKTQEEKSRRYQVMLAGVSEDVKSRLPADFDEDFMTFSMSKAMTMDELLEGPSVMTVGGEHVVHNNLGQETERAAIPKKETAGGGSKAADENAMYRQAAELMGGIFDDKGELLTLDPETRKTVQSIATEATKLWEQGGMTRSEAVSIAANKFGLNVKGVPQENPNDPNNIRNFLLQ